MYSVLNSTNNSHQIHDLSYSDREQIYIVTAVGLPILFTAAIANFFTLVAIYHRHWWRTGLQILILDLTLVDLFSSGVIYPATLLNIACGNIAAWSYEMYCQIQAYFFISCTFLSPMISTLIAINQFIVIVLPRSCQFLASRTCSFLWVFLTNSLVFCSFLFPLFEADGKLGAIPPFQSCGWLGKSGSKIHQNLHFFTNIICCFLIIPICYSAVFGKLYIHDRKISGDTAHHAEDAANRKRRLKRRRRTAKTMFVSFLAFAMTYIALPVYYFAYTENDFYDPRFSAPVLLAWLFLIYWTGAVCTPVFYWCLNPDFRKAYNEVIRLRCICKLKAMKQPAFEDAAEIQLIHRPSMHSAARRQSEW